MTTIFWLWPALTWYAGILFLALAGWPWVERACSSLPGKGAGLAVPGGLLFFFLGAQILWRVPFLPVHPAWLWTGVWVAGGVGWRAFNPAPPGPRARRQAAHGLLVFSLAFWFWTLVRAADPAANHTEQPMDVMWIQAAMVSDAPPVRDAWFGGAPNTYYVEGHQKIAFLARLFGTPLPLAVNLGQITFFALTASLAWQAAALVGFPWRRSLDPLAGWIGVGLTFLSNPPGFRDALRPGSGWWWWESTRVLFDGDIPMITEFPFFSFWLGDNHAHMLALPALLLSVLASLQILRARRIRFAHAVPVTLALVWGWRTNSWQAPTALALPLIALAGRFRARGIHLPDWRLVAGFALPLLLLFPTKDGSMFQGLHPNTFGIRPPWALLKVFGFFVPGLLLAAWAALRSRKGPRFAGWIALLCLGMLATCEVVFVVDVFMSRMNTVFKVYYQVWILFALVAAAGWGAMLRPGTATRRKKEEMGAQVSAPALTAWERKKTPEFYIALALLVFPAAGLLYPARLAAPAFFSRTKSLDALSVESTSRREWVVAARDRIQPGDLIAEFPGQSFNPNTSVLGTWTAGDNVLGWTGHMEQWRPDVVFPDLIYLYTASSPRRLDAELDRLEVDWVLAGPLEHRMYAITEEWHGWMRWRFHIAHMDGETVLYGPRR